MKVNMNGLRHNIVDSLASLTDKLNCSINDEGMLMLDPDSIRQDLNELQSFVAGLCCIYEPNDETFADMSDYVHLPDFAPIEEDE